MAVQQHFFPAHLADQIISVDAEAEAPVAPAQQGTYVAIAGVKAEGTLSILIAEPEDPTDPGDPDDPEDPGDLMPEQLIPTTDYTVTQVAGTSALVLELSLTTTGQAKRDAARGAGYELRWSTPTTNVETLSKYAVEIIENTTRKSVAGTTIYETLYFRQQGIEVAIGDTASAWTYASTSGAKVSRTLTPPAVVTPLLGIANAAMIADAMETSANLRFDATSGGPKDAYGGNAFLLPFLEYRRLGADAPTNIKTYVRNTMDYLISGTDGPTFRGHYHWQHEAKAALACKIGLDIPDVVNWGGATKVSKWNLVIEAYYYSCLALSSDWWEAPGGLNLSWAYGRDLRGRSSSGRKDDANYNIKGGYTCGIMLAIGHFGLATAKSMAAGYTHGSSTTAGSFLKKLYDAGLTNIYNTFNWKAANSSATCLSGAQIQANIRNWTAFTFNLDNWENLYKRELKFVCNKFNDFNAYLQAERGAWGDRGFLRNGPPDGNKYTALQVINADLGRGKMDGNPAYKPAVGECQFREFFARDASNSGPPSNVKGGGPRCSWHYGRFTSNLVQCQFLILIVTGLLTPSTMQWLKDFENDDWVLTRTDALCSCFHDLREKILGNGFISFANGGTDTSMGGTNGNTGTMVRKGARTKSDGTKYANNLAAWGGESNENLWPVVIQPWLYTAGFTTRVSTYKQISYS